MTKAQKRILLVSIPVVLFAALFYPYIKVLVIDRIVSATVIASWNGTIPFLPVSDRNVSDLEIVSQTRGQRHAASGEQKELLALVNGIRRGKKMVWILNNGKPTERSISIWLNNGSEKQSIGILLSGKDDVELVGSKPIRGSLYGYIVEDPELRSFLEKNTA